MKTSTIALGFRIAAGVNVGGILLFSRGLTNDRLIALSPVVFSRFGLVVVLLWGLAYLSVAKAYEQVPGLVWVFALEKLVYFATWIGWVAQHGADWPDLSAQAPLTATFYAIYGPADLLFAIFFGLAAFQARFGLDEPALRFVSLFASWSTFGLGVGLMLLALALSVVSEGDGNIRTWHQVRFHRNLLLAGGGLAILGAVAAYGRGPLMRLVLARMDKPRLEKPNETWSDD